MELVDVVRKLVGPIEPVGSHEIDEERLKNLKAMTDLVNELLSDIDSVIPNKRRPEASMKIAGQHADDFFDQIGIQG